VVGACPVSYQWHIFLARLDPIEGSEQAGTRPVLVVSREAMNRALPAVNVVPLTSRKSTTDEIYPNEVLLPQGTAGLAVDSIALTYQVRTLDKRRLSRDLGEVSDVTLQ
jgi:mRNA interferase MazF